MENHINRTMISSFDYFFSNFSILCFNCRHHFFFPKNCKFKKSIMKNCNLNDQYFTPGKSKYIDHQTNYKEYSIIYIDFLWNKSNNFLLLFD